MILQRKKEDLAPIFKVYSMDHSVTLKLIKKISSQFSFIKNSDSLEQLESSIDQLFEDIIQVTTLEKYFINKDESLIFPLISEYIPVHLQPKLTRYFQLIIIYIIIYIIYIHFIISK